MFDNLLTTFEGPDEGPLSEGGNWQRTIIARPPLRRLSNSATDSSHGDANYSNWVTPYSTDPSGILDAFGCTTGGQLGTALETWRVALWSVLGASLTGYLAYFGGGISKGYVLRNYSGGLASFTDIAASGATLSYPEQIGIRINGTEVECWGMDAGVWSLKCSATDTDYRGQFYSGLGIEDPTGGGLAFTCFGAGTRQRTQIYRILRGYPDV